MHIEKISAQQALKNHYYLKFLYEATHKKPVVEAPPLEVMIEASSFCNYSCSHCPQSKMTRKKKLMDYPLFKKVIGDIAPYHPFVSYVLQGEPLVNKQLPLFVKFVDESGLQDQLITNISLLTKAKSRELILAGLDYIYLSMSGATKKIYEKVHINGNFETVLNNLLDFIEAKAELEAYDVRIATAFVEETATKSDKAKYLEMFGKLPIDVVGVSALFNFFGHNEEEEKNKTKNIPKEKRSPCPVLWKYFSVTADGMIRLCPFDYNSQLALLGDARKDNVMEAWNSPEAQRVRKAHLEGEHFGVCLECNMPAVCANEFPSNFALDAEKFAKRGYAQAYRSNKEKFLEKYEYIRTHRQEWLKTMLEG